MDIKTNEQAVDLLNSVLFALDQISIQGEENWYAALACKADIRAIIGFLKAADTENEGVFNFNILKKRRNKLCEQ